MIISTLIVNNLENLPYWHDELQITLFKNHGIRLNTIQFDRDNIKNSITIPIVLSNDLQLSTYTIFSSLEKEIKKELPLSCSNLYLFWHILDDLPLITFSSFFCVDITTSKAQGILWIDKMAKAFHDMTNSIINSIDKSTLCIYEIPKKLFQLMDLGLFNPKYKMQIISLLNSIVSFALINDCRTFSTIKIDCIRELFFNALFIYLQEWCDLNKDFELSLAVQQSISCFQRKRIKVSKNKENEIHNSIKGYLNMTWTNLDVATEFLLSTKNDTILALIKEL